MKYAIEVLKKEKSIIDACLGKDAFINYPDALKRQKNKSKELSEAIKTLSKNLSN